MKTGNKISPWLPMDASWWPSIAKTLTDSRLPWPDEAIRQDLRWWQDQVALGRERLPSRRRLCSRWNRKDGRPVRRLMRDETSWADPRKPSLLDSRRSTPVGPKRAQSGPNRPEGNADNQPKRAQSGPKAGHMRARGRSSLDTTTTTSPPKPPKGARRKRGPRRRDLSPQPPAKAPPHTLLPEHATFCWCRDNGEPPPHASEQDLSAAADHARRYHLPVPTCLQHFANVVPFRATQQEEA